MAGAGLLTIPLAYTLLSLNGMVSETDKFGRRESARVPTNIEAKGWLNAPGAEPWPPAGDLADAPDSTVGVVNFNPPIKADPHKPAIYVTRRALPLREYPRFAATSKARVRAGTSVVVLADHGNWLKVKSRLSEAVGYVRKEYLTRSPSIQ